MPPYNPMAGRRSTSSRTRGMREIKPVTTRSLLDCSVLDSENGKILLTTQYRVVSTMLSLCQFIRDLFPIICSIFDLAQRYR